MRANRPRAICGARGVERGAIEDGAMKLCEVDAEQERRGEFLRLRPTLFSCVYDEFSPRLVLLFRRGTNSSSKRNKKDEEAVDALEVALHQVRRVR